MYARTHKENEVIRQRMQNLPENGIMEINPATSSSAAGIATPLEIQVAASTPDIAGDVEGRLNIANTSSENEDDSSMEDISSETSQDEDEIVPDNRIRQLPTGLCYDDRMRYHAEVSSVLEASLHPEDPRRIYAIFKELVDAGLVAGDSFAKHIVDQPLYRIKAREATRDECCLVHTQAHWDFISSLPGQLEYTLVRCGCLQEQIGVTMN